MENSRILVHLDTDVTPSLFDRIVAFDAGADQVLSYGAVRLEQVPAFVRGVIFSRDDTELVRTAVYVGGSDLAVGEVIFKEFRKHLMPQHGLHVSLMLNSDSANTTAAAAVATAAKHLDLANTAALILGGTGPTGQRIARLLARAGADVRLGSRNPERADFVATAIRNQVSGAKIKSVSTASTEDAPAALAGAGIVIAAGAVGSVVLPKKLRAGATNLKVAIDLNPVPPAGIEGVELNDAGTEREGVVYYGAKAIGTLRLKLQRAAIEHLFRRNDLVLDAEQICDLVPTLD
jgi:methylenetetrahydrofolate/methylenetetrahydromethanopterin dehydrogenase (NADP+)